KRQSYCGGELKICSALDADRRPSSRNMLALTGNASTRHEFPLFARNPPTKHAERGRLLPLERWVKRSYAIGGSMQGSGGVVCSWRGARAAQLGEAKRRGRRAPSRRCACSSAFRVRVSRGGFRGGAAAIPQGPLSRMRA